MKLPSYPIATIDPHFSIWSKTDKINTEDTYLWCGIKKRIEGTVTVDGETFSFLGNAPAKKLEQTSTKISAFVAEYSFEGKNFGFVFTTWSPFLFDNLQVLAAPCAFLDTKITFNDGKEHSVSVDFTAFDELCLGEKKKRIIKETKEYNGISIAKMGLAKQKPLNDSGDTFAADWGYVCFGGEKCGKSDTGLTSSHTAKAKGSATFSTVIAYDDVYSINYFGSFLSGLWAEKFSSIEDAITYCLKNRSELLEKIIAQNERIESDARPLGDNYVKMLNAATRQVFAGHKLVKSKDGELLYLSKECHSNGCINTVDVSYPAMPLFLLYCPKLVKAMLTGIFHFAEMPVWKHDFAPHDIGRYPLACGQVYAFIHPKHFFSAKRGYKKIYKSKSPDIYTDKYQMPVEECGNMIILSYSYFVESGDKAFLDCYFSQLEMWANYLVNKGVILDNQLCTDDFAGHSTKNVNLAIKGIMGIACFGRICDALGKDSNYLKTAADYAAELCDACEVTDTALPFSVGNKDSWSLKYNLVWDKIYGFNLFSKDIYTAESLEYRRQINKYGVPLDYRRDFTKSDWMLWAACLDETKENVDLFAEKILLYLAETKDKNCFSDWFETKEAKQCGFSHRTVQGGLWMPVFAAKHEK